jgi:hypothetical protein
MDEQISWEYRRERVSASGVRERVEAAREFMERYVLGRIDSSSPALYPWGETVHFEQTYTNQGMPALRASKRGRIKTRTMCTFGCQLEGRSDKIFRVRTQDCYKMNRFVPFLISDEEMDYTPIVDVVGMTYNQDLTKLDAAGLRTIRRTFQRKPPVYFVGVLPLNEPDDPVCTLMQWAIVPAQMYNFIRALLTYSEEGKIPRPVLWGACDHAAKKMTTLVGTDGRVNFDTVNSSNYSVTPNTMRKQWLSARLGPVNALVFGPQWYEPFSAGTEYAHTIVFLWHSVFGRFGTTKEILDNERPLAVIVPNDAEEIYRPRTEWDIDPCLKNAFE